MNCSYLSWVEVLCPCWIALEDVLLPWVYAGRGERLLADIIFCHSISKVHARTSQSVFVNRGLPYTLASTKLILGAIRR